MEKVELFLKLITKSRSAVVLTGAGISTDSGIPDYRSPGTGLWEKMDQSVVSLSGFLKKPESYYSYALELHHIRSQAKPNIAHNMLATLEKDGLVKAVITQNVDGLHKEAGSKSVYELHGSLREAFCLSCNSLYLMEHIMQRVKKGDNPPLCEKCGGIVKPRAVFFGEQLPVLEWEKSLEWVNKTDFLFIVGSSLQVSPVNSFPLEAVRGGAKVAILNIQETPFDRVADLVIHEKIGDFFADLHRLYGKNK
ncbi:MAG: NAD-dependent protein deacylase [Candidatus Dadabacteria bacterium]|nr:NAD-dependent protein deacylase [Candidatus Dadabacteria bacterium]